MLAKSGDCVTLEPGIRRILAPNPSALTGPGTNTFLVGEGEIAVIDPGPNDQGHFDAILAAVEPDERISHIFVTHSHRDHSTLSQPLALATGAKVHAFGNSSAGRSAVMDYLAASGELGGGEGLDTEFVPDVCLADEEIVAAGDWELQALWTPGHCGNHMCFAFRDVLFTGDMVLDWATTLVSPPDGDLAAFLGSCRRLAARGDRIYYTAHGEPVAAPQKRVNWLIAHRQDRERQILEALKEGLKAVPEITRHIYTDISGSLVPAAERNVLAHLIDLTTSNRIMSKGTLGPNAVFWLQ